MKRTILAPGHELLSYRIHEVTPYINWIYFFHAWGFQPRFAAIANIHGCDSCRALWLTTFPEEERTKASEAMQLFKEANRMLDRLDETISIHCIFRLCQANADGDNLLIEGTTFPLLRQRANAAGAHWKDIPSTGKWKGLLPTDIPFILTVWWTTLIVARN